MVDEGDAATGSRSPAAATGPVGDAHDATGGGVGADQDADKIPGAASSSASPPTGLDAPPVDRAAGALPGAGSSRRGGVEAVPGQRLVAGPRTARICAPLWKVFTQ